MEQHDQERSWKSDPRLHHMDAKKIALLASFADELAAAPEAQRINMLWRTSQLIKPCVRRIREKSDFPGGTAITVYLV